MNGPRANWPPESAPAWRYRATCRPMSVYAALLIVTGALLHALWNFSAKKASGGLPFIWLYGLVSLSCLLPFGWHAWSSLPDAFSLQVWAAILASAIVHVAYCLWLQKGYQQADFSVVYPVARGAGPLF